MSEIFNLQTNAHLGLNGVYPLPCHLDKFWSTLPKINLEIQPYNLKIRCMPFPFNKD